jgi:hypothetical protein
MSRSNPICFTSRRHHPWSLMMLSRRTCFGSATTKRLRQQEVVKARSLGSTARHWRSRGPPLRIDMGETNRPKLHDLSGPGREARLESVDASSRELFDRSTKRARSAPFRSSSDGRRTCGRRERNPGRPLHSRRGFGGPSRGANATGGPARDRTEWDQGDDACTSRGRSTLGSCRALNERIGSRPALTRDWATLARRSS